MPSPEPLEISIVIACLNEDQTLQSVILKAQECFRKYNLRGEVVVADNGSTDGSQRIARDCGARVVIEHQKGYGATLRNGLKEARGEFVIIGDADGSHNFMEAERFVAKLREGYDFVIGSRFKGEIKPGAMPWLHRYIGNPLMTFIMNILYQVGISDSQCGMRGFKREVIRKMDLRTNGMDFASELLIKAVRSGLKIVEVPITMQPSGRNRPPHLKSIPDGWRHLRLMLLFAPNMLFIYPGIFFTILGLILQTIIYLKKGIYINGLEFSNKTMIAGMMMTIIGFQVFYLGLFSHLFINFKDQKENDPLTKFILKFSKFEKGIVVGGLIFLLGLLGDVIALKRQHVSVFVAWDLHVIRVFVFYSTFVILGFQTMAASFLLNMIGIGRRIYSADLNETNYEPVRK